MVSNAISDWKILRVSLWWSGFIWFEVTHWLLDSSEPQRSSSRSPSHPPHGGVSIAPASGPCRWHTQCSKPIDIFISSTQCSSLPWNPNHPVSYLQPRSWPHFQNQNSKLSYIFSLIYYPHSHNDFTNFNKITYPLRPSVLYSHHFFLT